MVNAQQWLNKEFPKSTRNEITKLIINNKELKGKLTLSLEDFPNLERLDCSDNLLTEIVFTAPYDRTRSSKSNSKKQKLEWKLKSVNLYNNNFSRQSLDVFAEFTEMEELLIGTNDLDKNNNFFGSLKSLQKLTKLKRLDVSNTDISSGIEYLPNSLERINFSSEIKQRVAKVRNVELALEKFNFKRASDDEILIDVKRLKRELVQDFCQAAEKDEYVKVENILVSYEGIVNLRDEYDNTALHYAASKGNVEIVDLLLAKGAEVNVQGNHKFTPLHVAVGQEQWDIVVNLLTFRANPNIKDEEGNTPLHFAAEGNDLKLLKLLFKYGGNLNAVNEYKWSILHSAVSGLIKTAGEEDNWKIVKWLLEKGAKSDAETAGGISVKDILGEHNFSYVKKYEELLEEIKSEVKLGEEDFSSQSQIPPK